MPLHRLGRRRTAPLAIAGLLTALATPALAGAETAPLAAGDQLYVTNGALAQQDPEANVVRFRIDTTGRVTPVDSDPAGDSARGMVFTAQPDAQGLRYAYVASSDSNQIDGYRVAADGALTPIDPTPASAPFGIAISPNGRSVYVSHFEPGGKNRSLSAYCVGAGGVLTLISSVDSGVPHAKGVAVTPDGRFAYVSHGAPNEPEPGVLTGFAIRSDGSIRDGTVARTDVGSTGHRVVITPDGRFVYVTGQDAVPAAPDVFGFRIGAYGGLTPVPGRSFNAGTWVEGAAVSPDGRRLYVTALDTVGPDEEPVEDGRIRGFAIGADGRLTEIANLKFGFDPIDLAFGLDGKHLYVSDFAADTVAVFSVGATGNLEWIQTVESGGDDPGFQSVAVRPASQ